MGGDLGHGIQGRRERHRIKEAEHISGPEQLSCFPVDLPAGSREGERYNSCLRKARGIVRSVGGSKGRQGWIDYEKGELRQGGWSGLGTLRSRGRDRLEVARW